MSRSFLIKAVPGALLSALLGLTACQSHPDYALSQQQAVSPVTSWQSAASQTWDEVSGRLAAGGYKIAQISLEPPVEQTAFTQALDNFLFTEAVDHGVAISPGAPFTITYDTQIIRHAADSDTAEPMLTPGITDSTDTESTSDGTTELMLNVSVTDGSSVRIRESRVFNISDGDIPLYQQGHADRTAAQISNEPLVASNWYADNPHDVLPLALQQDNQFAVMVDQATGPVHSIGEATDVAARHCGTLGMAQAKYISQGFPTNDRNQIRVVYECM